MLNSSTSSPGIKRKILENLSAQKATSDIKYQKDKVVNFTTMQISSNGTVKPCKLPDDSKGVRTLSATRKSLLITNSEKKEKFDKSENVPFCTALKEEDIISSAMSGLASQNINRSSKATFKVITKKKEGNETKIVEDK